METTMHWGQISREQPRLAALGVQRLAEPGVVLVGTIRADGTPRISPVEPLFWRHDLWLSMLWGSRKAADLRRDPRVLVHSIVTSRDGRAGEYKVRGSAIAASDPHVQADYASTVQTQLGWSPTPGRFHLFWVDITDVTFIRYEDATGDQFVTRWPPGSEYVRRGDSATSLGEPEHYADLLVT
jgi:Pyridoxamine 5'-phosphate oxidase